MYHYIEVIVVKALLQPVALGIYFLTFATGVVGALLLPTLSIFFAEEVGVSPFWVGVPYAGIAVGSIIYNHLIGEWSDSLRDRRALVVGLCAVGIVGALVFAYSRHYWLTSLSAIFLLSLAMVSFSQILAYSLEYAESHLPLERIALFNAAVRAQIAFAWVAGPPAGFLIVSHFGFTRLYLVAAGLFAAVAVISPKLLPALKLDPLQTEQPKTKVRLLTGLDRKARVSLLYCSLAFSVFWCVNNAYLISLPLHLTRNLGIETGWIGWIMGAAAGLEVPVMLLAGVLASRINPLVLVRASGIAALILYVGVYFATSLWQLFALQFANAIFIGVLAGIGVSVVQTMLPGRAGSASALYTNTTHVGTLLSSALVGGVAELFGYQSVFVANIFLVVLALLLFAAVTTER
ncbi:sugar efflux transporter [Gilvimarinus sp. SDUM040013]|uniref:Sugar efflux transporter n=1 Tax=Gilvimarinus gilvus TaxID=3058038 RepID=A0ABU4RZ19_9GAMM|nr:sugar efflux transporter [Gilvimarinus sp. SDUM040013]MDO3386302.1 sugar efflux transporter [Gilvimarinus sp. SDUM040013]MDX6850040.1 sugar efflux transporter [Gilvimarinus sp. SDUM040013]